MLDLLSTHVVIMGQNLSVPCSVFILIDGTGINYIPDPESSQQNRLNTFLPKHSAS